jgi:pre-mRNA-splicing helicase BRR2
VEWLGSTYYYVRALKEPSIYQVDSGDDDPALTRHRADLVHTAATKLDKCGLVRYDRAMGAFVPTELGRISSHFYITCDTVSVRKF